MAIAAVVVALNLLLPLLLFDPVDDVMTLVVCFMATSGISSFKALAWCLNRGPLADPRLTPGQFAAVYGLTLIPALPGMSYLITKSHQGTVGKVCDSLAF
jgi:hypothetical protein